eukprot:scaffold6469_cov112-Cylindrotheca_fusiformis.AAC.2
MAYDVIFWGKNVPLTTPYGLRKLVQYRCLGIAAEAYSCKGIWIMNSTIPLTCRSNIGLVNRARE